MILYIIDSQIPVLIHKIKANVEKDSLDFDID